MQIGYFKKMIITKNISVKNKEWLFFISKGKNFIYTKEIGVLQSAYKSIYNVLYHSTPDLYKK